MSLNIQCVSNSCDFSNEFSEGFDLPANSQIALTKCNLSTPLFVQNVLYMPQIAALDRANASIYVQIDGIIKEITWTDLFVAWSNYTPGTNVEPNITAGDFFSGYYPFFTNNKVFFNTVGGSLVDGDKANFSVILAMAISQKFHFYTCTDCSEWDSQGLGIGNYTGGDTEITLVGEGGHIYNNCSIHVAHQSKIRLNIRYNPWAITSELPIVNTYVIGDCTDFTPGPATLVAAALTPSMAVGNQTVVDINGGYYRIQPTWVGGTFRWGLNLNGRAYGLDNIAHSAILANLNPIEIGLVFTTVSEYNIIDGVLQTTTYNGAAIENGHQQVLVHQGPMNTYTNGVDYFYIVIERGNETTNGTSEFVFKLFQGSDDITDWNATRPVYTWKRSLQSPSIVPTEIFMSTGGLNSVANMAYIPQGEDSEIQRKQMNIWGIGCRNTFSIQPNQDTNNRAVMNFWASLGIHNFHQAPAGPVPPPRVPGDPLVDYLNSSFIISYEGTELNKTIEWKTDYKAADDNGTNMSRYWFGIDDLKKFFIYNAIGEEFEVVGLNNGWIVNWNEQLKILPKALSVYVNNLQIKNYEGSHYALTETQTQTGNTRLVSTIPFILNKSEYSQEFDIDYETYNPYYRPISNPESMRINQLIIEISFKDPSTNKKKVIENINGLLRCEFSVRKGSPPKVNQYNGLVPII